MTFGSLINWGGFGKTPAIHPIERYHSGGYHSGNYWEHKSGHSKSYSKGGGGSGAALSALTLLAFLFLLNVMQQSLQDNNSTMTTAGTGAMTLLLRNGQQPVSLDAREETGQKIGNHEPEASNGATKSKAKKKGDTLGDSIDDQIYVIPVP